MSESDKPGLFDVLKSARTMQQSVEEMQKQLHDQLNHIEAVGESGGGMVKITLTGHRDAKNVTLEDSALKEDKEVLEDLIAAAIKMLRIKLSKRLKQKSWTSVKTYHFPKNSHHLMTGNTCSAH